MSPTRRLPILLACALALAAVPALAQPLPVFNVSNRPYVPLAGGTALSFTTTGTFSALDEGYSIVTLPFAFPYFGNSYTQALVNTNGLVTFNLNECFSTSCYSNGDLPSTAAPNNAIYGWWDDLTMTSSGSVIAGSDSGEYVIQFTNVPSLTTSAPVVNFQIRLSPSGTIAVHYGTFTGAAGSATVGIEGPGGTQALKFLAKSGQTCSNTNQSGCCTGSSTPNACTGADVTAGTYILIGEPEEADLGVPAVTLSNLVVQADNNISFTVHANVRNYGKTDANGWHWKAYLSTDKVLNAGDVLVASGGPVNLAQLTAVTIDSPAATTTPPATGQYYVLFEVDTANVVTEASEANNVGSTVDTFVSGLDLVAASVSGVANSGGGNVDPIQVNWRNRGTTSPGPVQFRILLSTDQTLDANDFVIHNGTRTVTGAETIAETVQVTMPAAAPDGEFYYLLQIDPNNQLVEATKTNNVVASAGRVTVRRADIVVGVADVIDPATGLTATSARFGEPVRATIKLTNGGGANANNFYVGLVVSNDASLSLLSDTLVCEQLVSQLVSGAAAITVTLDCTMPTQTAGGAAFDSGQYYLFLVADSRGSVYESNKGNNNVMMGPLRITAPGADLTVGSVVAPATAGVGEIIPVVRTLRNIGTRDAPETPYRYFASVNDIITVDDIPLDIIDPSTGSAATGGTVTLARGSAETETELVRLPGSMPPGPYHIGCIIDPERTVADLDYDNNALGSAVVQVATASLRIVTATLPDASVGQPFLFRLAAVGGQGTSTWSIVADGGAPGWLSIAPADGTLTGAPDASGIVAFTAQVENDGRRALKRFAMRVLPPTAQVTVTTTTLPAVVNAVSTVYSYSLGAAGGMKPYAWSVAQGALPNGLTLSAEGVLSGTPRNVQNGETPVVVEVRDASGGRARRELVVRLTPAGSLVLRTLTLSEALVGQDYLQDLAAENADGTQVALPLTWTITGGLPDGLTLTQRAEIATLAGKARQAGQFVFTVTVQDAIGRSDTLTYSLLVHAQRYRVMLAGLPEALHPGDAMSGALSVSPAGTVSYALVAGALPPGVSLGADGALTGTVAEEGSLGVWTFVVEARDAAGTSGLGAMAVEVVAAPVKSGCASVDLSGMPLAFLGVLALLRRRRRAR